MSNCVTQARLDAVADAETLRLFMLDGRHFVGLRHPQGWYLAYMDLGHGARQAIRLHHGNVAARRALHAARAAFRAAPGLRG